ncbi:HU family DNA-binding protein [Pseudogemmobacter faecipullorum]|uniref:HU family DNA-binding protein n=1 Tax=Pseudogemmobacter faecipullorum TaxID=2755041 RepID=A0ABS8CQY6_9RHOB|nr:HU family DNA-binding protein [Pseudogemmobacter faecipullorum]MCB5411819.1 HU family DNA-binding protein [Pseudogemmobacter faecipullorum]
MSKLTKADIVKAIIDDVGINKAQTNAVLDRLASLAKSETDAGRPFTLPGVVKLTQKHRAARTARNPKTGEAVQVPAKTVVTAKALIAA